MKKILSYFHRKYKFTFKNFKEDKKLILYNFVIRQDISLNKMVTDTYPFTLIEASMEDVAMESDNNMGKIRFYSREYLTLRDFTNGSLVFKKQN